MTGNACCAQQVSSHTTSLDGMPSKAIRKTNSAPDPTPLVREVRAVFALQPPVRAYNARYMTNEEEYVEGTGDATLEDADTTEETADTTAPDEVVGAENEEPTRSSPVAIVALLLVTLLVASGVTWFVTQQHTEHTAQEVTSSLPATTTASTSLAATTPPPPPPQETVTFSREGFRITLPEGWRSVPPTMMLPEGMSGAVQAFALPGTTCTIAYATMGTAAEYVQTTGYTDVTNNEHLLGRIERRIPATYASTSTTAPEVKHSASPYEPHEFAFSYQPLYYDNASDDATRNAFVLFGPNGATVARECHGDFIALIGSIAEALPQYTLTPSDRGVLSIQTSRTGTDLLFRTYPTQELYRIARLSAGAVFKPTLQRETLYYVHNSGALYAYPLFAASAPLRLPLPLAPGERVNDFEVASDTIEYLRGTWCRSTPEECALTHEAYDLATGMVTTLETDVSTPTLEAEEEMAQSLVVEQGTIAEGPQNPKGIAPQRIPIVTY